MEEYLRWQIEQLKATVAKQDKIIQTLTKKKAKELIKNNIQNSIVHTI